MKKFALILAMATIVVMMTGCSKEEERPKGILDSIQEERNRILDEGVHSFTENVITENILYENIIE